MVRIVILSVFFLFSSHFLKASEKDPTGTGKLSQGLMLGGMLSEGESFLMAKYEYLIGNVGLQIVMSREALNRQYDFDQSADRYRRLGYGLTLRYYVPDVLRGFYGGAALSSTTASISTDFRNGEASDDSFLNLGGIELGYRIGGNRKGLTGEIGYRRMYTFNELHISTHEAVTFSDIKDGMSPHAWSMEAGDHFDKFFIGLGYIF